MVAYIVVIYYKFRGNSEVSWNLVCFHYAKLLFPKHTEAEIKWSTICKHYFQIHFIQ